MSDHGYDGAVIEAIDTIANAAAARAEDAAAAVDDLKETVGQLDNRVRALAADIEARARAGHGPISLTAGIWVIGTRTAAAYVGATEDTFRAARARCPIDGERIVGVLPAWPMDQLDTWKGAIES